MLLIVLLRLSSLRNRFCVCVWLFLRTAVVPWHHLSGDDYVATESFYGRLIGSVVGHLAMACLILHQTPTMSSDDGGGGPGGTDVHSPGSEASGHAVNRGGATALDATRDVTVLARVWTAVAPTPIGPRRMAPG